MHTDGNRITSTAWHDELRYAFNSKLDVSLVCNGDTAMAQMGRQAIGPTTGKPDFLLDY